MSLLAKWAQPRVRFIQGDVRIRLAEMADNTFDCAVTSPPYFGLRDYGVAGQIGLEPTLSEYLDEMTAVCHDIRRVLKPAGTFWLNIGDSYAGSWGARGRGALTGAARPDLEAKHGTIAPNRHGCPSLGIKPKDLCMVPARLAIRLQEDGWYVRSAIVWAKPNPMPESVTDRPTSSYENVFMLSKSERYFFDAKAVAEPSREVRQKGNSWAERKARGEPTRHGLASAAAAKAGGFATGETRNLRNVWTIATKPFKEAHFATFPQALAETCIKAGCPIGGHVLDPFGGAGTTGLVAKQLGRNATLLELNPEYIEIARRRIANS